MSLLSGHTSPDTFPPGTPPPRPAYPVPPRSYRSYHACLCSLYWGAPDSRGGGCMGYRGSAEGGHLPRQHGHLGHSPALGYRVSRQPFPGHRRSGQGSSDCVTQALSQGTRSAESPCATGALLEAAGATSMGPGASRGGAMLVRVSILAFLLTGAPCDIVFELNGLRA